MLNEVHHVLWPPVALCRRSQILNCCRKYVSACRWLCALCCEFLYSSSCRDLTFLGQHWVGVGFESRTVSEPHCVVLVPKPKPNHHSFTTFSTCSTSRDLRYVLNWYLTTLVHVTLGHLKSASLVVQIWERLGQIWRRLKQNQEVDLSCQDCGVLSNSYEAALELKNCIFSADRNLGPLLDFRGSVKFWLQLLNSDF